MSLNERLRDDYVADCQRGVNRWNQIIKNHGIDVRAARCPHRAFHRAIGGLRRRAGVARRPRRQRRRSGTRATATGCRTEEDQAYVGSLMQAGDRARQVRQLDRAARARRQQPADRVRIRPAELTEEAPWPPPPRRHPEALRSALSGCTRTAWSAPAARSSWWRGRSGWSEGRVGRGRRRGRADASRRSRTCAPCVEAAGCTMQQIVRPVADVPDRTPRTFAGFMAARGRGASRSTSRTAPTRPTPCSW